MSAIEPGNFIMIDNNEMEIKDTNYFKTKQAKNGYIYFSFNAGACRVLVPEITANPFILSEMNTAKRVEVSYEAMPSNLGGETGDGYIVIFDDGTAAPFSLITPLEGCDRKLLKKDHNQKMMLIVYFEKEGKHVEVYRKKAVFKYNR